MIQLSTAPSDHVWDMVWFAFFCVVLFVLNRAAWVLGRWVGRKGQDVDARRGFTNTNSGR